MDTVLKPVSRRTMPQRVDVHVVHAGLLRGGRDRPQDISGVHRLPRLGCENVARVRPDIRRLDALLELGLAMLPKYRGGGPPKWKLRRDLLVFGSVMTNRPLTRERVPRTCSTPPSRSTSDHFKARASPLRSPVVAMSVRIDRYLVPVAAARTLATSAAGRCETSKCGTVTLSEASTGLLARSWSRTAPSSASRRTRMTFSIVDFESARTWAPSTSLVFPRNSTMSESTSEARNLSRGFSAIWDDST